MRQLANVWFSLKVKGKKSKRKIHVKSEFFVSFRTRFCSVAFLLRLFYTFSPCRKDIFHCINAILLYSCSELAKADSYSLLIEHYGRARYDLAAAAAAASYSVRCYFILRYEFKVHRRIAAKPSKAKEMQRNRNAIFSTASHWLSWDLIQKLREGDRKRKWKQYKPCQMSMVKWNLC